MGQKIYSKIREAKIARDSETVEEISSNFAKRLNKYLVSISSDKIKYFQREVTELSTKLDELSRQQLDLRIELGDQQKKVTGTKREIGRS